MFGKGGESVPSAEVQWVGEEFVELLYLPAYGARFEVQ